MNIAIIPARGGSKRIPGKNTRLFCGKPMILWSIEAALASGVFDQVIVSTDDAKIAELARAHGAEVPFIRPKSLSDDYTGTQAVIRHACDYLASNDLLPDYVCCIYATAPFIDVNDIKFCLAQLKEKGANYCFPITSFAYPIQRALKIESDGTMNMFNPELFHKRSQDLIEAWHDAGMFYWGTFGAWLAQTPIFTKSSVPVILPRERVQDIDTPEDWLVAEIKFRIIENEHFNKM
jgi:N-acylneuraminate cytidylyltransferase